jgi:hypothetical protein
VKFDADRVADPGGEDLLVLAVLIETDDAADSRLVVEVRLLLGWHVEGLPERHVELVVGTNAAHASRVVVALLGCGDELTLLQHLKGRHVRALEEEFRSRELENAILLRNVEHAVA